MILRLVSFFIFSVTLFTLSGCSSIGTEKNDENETNKSENNELRIAVTAQPETLDNHITTATMASDIGRNIFETLVTLNSDYQPVPMLAETVEKSDDGKTYTFHLREGVKFHNGKELTSEDVVASMNRWVDKAGDEDLKSGGAFEEIDSHTVVLKLKQPMSDILDIMADRTQFPSIMPKEVVESSSSKGVTEYIGTGPFKFVEWKQDQYIHLAKFEEYQSVNFPSDGFSGEKEALVENIYFVIVPDPSTRVAGIQTGEYDIITETPHEHYEQLNDNDSLRAYPYQFGNMFLIYNKKDGIFSNKKLREAVNITLDMGSIMEASFSNKDLYDLGSGYMNINQKKWYSDVGKEFYNQNNQIKSEQLLSESNYDGEVVRIMTTRHYEFLYNASIVMKEQLENIGMKTELEVFDWPTVLDLQSNPEEWDLHITAAPIVVTPTKLLFLNPTWAGWTEDLQISQMLEKIRLSSEQEKAKEIWDELEGYLWNDYLPVSILGSYKKVIVTTNKIQGLTEFEGGVLWNTKKVE